MTRIVLVCLLAASAGVHSALAASHGRGFVVAAALLAAAAATVALRPSRSAAVATAGLLLGLLAAYALEHGPSMNSVALATKAAEAGALVLAVRLAVVTPAVRPDRVATLVAAAMVATFASAVTPAAEHGHPAGTPAHRH